MDIDDLNQRSLDIFRDLVETYVELGEPVGSRTLSKRSNLSLSPATIRNIMADLEDAGLLYSPHISSGRIPTELGMRLFVDGLLSQTTLEEVDLQYFESNLNGKSVESIIQETSEILSGLSHCASIVLAPKLERENIKHIEFLPLSETRGLVILISENGVVENRLIELPSNITLSHLNQASRYINYHLTGKTLRESHQVILKNLETKKDTLDKLTTKVIEQGLAVWAGVDNNALIIKGQSKLLENVHHLEDLNRIRELFHDLDEKEKIYQLIEAAINAQGIKIFIGFENELFRRSGCSMVITPYWDQNDTIIGAIGVIGPIHMNYRRIIPMVNYSAKLISRLISL